MSESRFRIGPEIVHEAVDGEVIAIDLGNGSYYSLAGSGPAIWELIGSGATESEVREALAASHEAPVEEISAGVSTFLAQLEENGLVVREQAAGNGRPAAIERPAAAGVPFEAPRFERYTDMKDYFLLDPIHEVDTAGWPKPAA